MEVAIKKLLKDFFMSDKREQSGFEDKKMPSFARETKHFLRLFSDQNLKSKMS